MTDVADAAPEMTAQPIAVETGDLGVKFARGVAWSGLAKALSQSAGWLATLFVARYLSPTDYGLFGLAMLYLGLLQLVADLGLSTAVLANRHLSDADLPQIHGLAALSGVAGAMLVAVTAPLVGMFFHAAQLPLLLVALSPTFFVNSLRTVPQTLLQREFRFKWLAFLDAGQSLALSGLSIVLAMAGFGYWTLAWAAIGSAIGNTAMVLWRKRLPFRWPRLDRMRALLAFSTQVILQRIAWYLSSNADFATAGRFLGKAATGSYMLAWSFAEAPIERVASLVLQVSPAVFGAAASNRAALKHHVLQATELISLLVFPMCFGMALVARPFVLVFLGQKWATTIVPLELLASYAAIRSLVPLLGQVLLVVNEEYYATRLMFINLLVMPLAFFVGAKVAGIVGIAAAYMIAHPFVAVAYSSRALTRVGSSFRELFTEALRPAVFCSACMAVVVLAVSYACRTMPLKIQLSCEIAGGAVAYGTPVALLYRRRLRLLVGTFRRSRLATAD